MMDEVMAIHVDMIALSQLPETVWLEVEPPKCKNQPLCRHIAYLSDLETWDGCAVPLSGIVIRDTYADKVVYQTVVTTDISAKAERIHEWIRTRWAIEETFMEESRYGTLKQVQGRSGHVGSALPRPSRTSACWPTHCYDSSLAKMKLTGKPSDPPFPSPAYGL